MWVHDHLRERLLRQAGLLPPIELDALYRSRWSPTFERLMRNRLVMGFYRYGEPPFGPGPRFDNAVAAAAKLSKYRETGNQELLVDVANLCLCEFLTRSSYPGARWQPSDDTDHTPMVACGRTLDPAQPAESPAEALPSGGGGLDSQGPQQAGPALREQPEPGSRDTRRCRQ